MNRPPMEPAADIRTMANMLRQLYVALNDEGFTDEQALDLVTEVMLRMVDGGDDT